MDITSLYSGLFIITPEKLDTIDDVKKAISEIIRENSGKIEKETVIGKKELAYPIKKKTKGVYYEVVFRALPASISEMTRLFKINTDILRTLIDKNQ